MSELPVGWAETTVGDLGADGDVGILTGPFGSNLGRADFRETGTAVFTIGCLSEDGIKQSKLLYIGTDKASELEAYRLREGDFLFSRMATVGRVGFVPKELEGSIFNYHLMRLRLDERKIEPRYFFHFVRGASSVFDYLESVNRGATRDGINTKLLAAMPVHLAPKQEQRRIVAKLDSLRARSSRARNELDHIPKLIERYKQAILAKAFSGELTKEWREHHTKIGTGAEALAKIEDARNSLLEGRAPTRRGPVSDGEAGRIPVELPELPATWEQSSLETITSPVRLIQYGILKPGDDVSGGVPYVKVMNIQGGHVRLEKIRRTTPEIHAQYRRSAIATGDILLSIRGTVGRLAFVPPELDGGNITQDSVRIDVLPGMNARFVYWYLHSPAAQDYFAKNQKGVAVRGINVGDVRPMEIPIPPEAEQVRIVTLVEHALAWLDKIATEHARAEYLLPKLDQSILAKAFRGELVPQDPNDEPASVLLERIKADREGGEQPRRRAAKA